MMEIRKLKDLVKLMVENDLSEIDLRDQDQKVTLRRGAPPASGGPAPVIQHVQSTPTPIAPTPTTSAPAAASAPDTAAADTSGAGGKAIESPMVGTFYTSPNPDAPAFVKVGDHVTADTVVCIIEAMKIFNEIKAETSGTIAKIVPDNGTSVEFGEPLFIVTPD